MVTDAAMATSSIAEVLNKLQDRTGKRIQDVYAGISSTSISVTSSFGVLLLSKYGREVSAGDIKKCVQIGSAVKMTLDREPLHRIVRGFSLDGEKEIKNPLNLEGVKLGVNVNILTVNSSALHNMSKCISHAGFIPAGFVCAGLASAYRVLSEKDKETGAALLDICGDLTEVMVFQRGTLSNCKVFSAGMDDILSEDGSIDTAGLAKLIPRIVSLPGWEKVRKAVVIGEGAFIDNLAESLGKSFAFPVTSGTCIVRVFENLPPERAGYIGSLGILDYLQEEKRKQCPGGNIIKRGFNRALGFIDKYF